MYDEANFLAAIYSGLQSEIFNLANSFWTPHVDVIEVKAPVLTNNVEYYFNKNLISDNKVNFDGIVVSGRLKGESPFHYIQDDKSLKLKTKKSHLFFGSERKLDLDKISHPAIIADLIAYDLALLLEVLIPSHRLELISINNNVPLPRYLIGSIDEQLLRNSRRMPNDIYVIKTTGKNIDVSTSGSLVNGFYFHNAWKKESYNNHFEKDSKLPLEILLNHLVNAKNGDQSARHKLLDMISVKDFASFIIFNQLIQSNHQDNVHNTGLFFDAWKRKFSPIAIDQMAWHGPFGSTFNQSIPNVDSITPLDFISAASLNNDLLDFLKSDPIVISEIINIWGEKRVAIEGLLSNLHEYRNFLEHNIPPFGHFYLGSSLSSKKDVIKAFNTLEAYIMETYSSTNNHITNLDSLNVNPTREKLELSGVVNFTEDKDFSDKFVYVHPGSIISLAPNVTLTFSDADFSGLKDSPILIKRLDPTRAFGSLLFQGGSSVNLSWVNLSGGSGQKVNINEATGQASFHDIKDLRITNSSFSNNAVFDDNVHIIYVDNFVIDNVLVENSLADGLDVDISKGLILNSVFRNNGNDGVDLMSSSVSIESSILHANGDKGVSVGEDTSLIISDSSLSNNNIAIEIKDRSKANFRDGLSFLSNITNVNLKRKNWRFSSGGVLTYNPEVYPELNPIVDKHSVVYFDL